MRLEDLTIVLRPRLPWEAVDLGCALTRRDYGRVMLLWLITVVPVWLILAALFWDNPMAFGLIAWWLKPLYDRVPLFHLSRAAFGSRPTVRETLREWPRLWSRFLLPALLWRRFSLMRSFALPVLMLEGQKGKASHQRISTLASDGGSSGTGVTWVFIKLEIALWLGLTALASNLGPADGLPDFSALMQDPENYFQVTNAQQWFSNVLYLIAMSVIEPFYVGAGFGLYLNSRTKLEGWDIELTFRRLAARLKPVVTALLMMALFLPGMTDAAEKRMLLPAEKVTTEEVSEARQTVQEILKKEEFKEHSRTTSVWVDDGEASMNPEITGLAALLMQLVGYALLALLIGLLIWWIVKNRHLYWGGAGLARARVEPAGPRVVMGLDIARESLPDDIVTAARAAWSAGHYREALSLLYRGSLSRLVEHLHLPIRDSDTEDDCLEKTAAVADASVTSFFRQLTLLWVRAAYAGKEALPDEFESLCRGWPFSSAPAASRGQRVIAHASLLLCSLLFLSACDGHFEDRTFPQGYKGKARLDPFLAAQYLLDDMGYDAERLPQLKELPEPDGGVIVISAEAGMPEVRAKQLLNWVQSGGHLVYAMAGCAPYSDWGLFSSGSTFGYAGNEDRVDPVLDKMKVEMLGLKDWKETALPELLLKRRKKDKDQDKNKQEDPDSPKKEAPKAEEKKPEPAPVKASEEKPGAESRPEKKKPRIVEPEDVPTEVQAVKIGNTDYKVSFPSIIHLKLGRKLRTGEWAAGGKRDKTTALHLHHGLGSVTLLNHARPLRNRYIDEHDHAQWFMDLIGEDAYHVQFIVSLEGSFWELLWKRAWMPLIGLALLVAIWLWMHLPRFGPQRQVVLHDTKHFFEHISALGGFFHRMRRDDVLLAAAADAVRARATRLYPHLVNHSDSAIIEILTQRSNLPPERIRAAFEASEKPSTRDFVRHIQDLQTMKLAL
ncbi:DUF4350 domain-containing protein [Brevifollis gellanilyticus]|uniref:Uncharacterized protein n=1 Tax=Brevifollis gellanilyticus TaxID=748831 RepID=A0A512MD64_9BACT|nr:DUF4350 domain-containing protein [Brevifollis gellanilyticus]GEP44680.1 hypothetical protein BGE01nite_39710 [Brevifollis gellanilyticus]